MRTINIYEAKTHLSKIAEAVAAGEEIIVAKANRPVMRLCPIEPKTAAPRIFGILKGKIHLGPDFDAPLPEDLLAAFEGESPP